MPDSMMSAATGSRPKVTGSSMAMVAVGPRPGRTPMAVPRNTPSRQYIRLVRVKAVSKPMPRLVISSMPASSVAEPSAEQRHGNTQALDEDQAAEYRESCGEQQGAPQLEMCAGIGACDDQQRQCDQQAGPTQKAGKQHDGAGDQDDAAQAERGDRFALAAQAPYRRDNTDGGQYPGEDGREIAGAHSQGGAHAVVAG